MQRSNHTKRNRNRKTLLLGTVLVTLLSILIWSWVVTEQTTTIDSVQFVKPIETAGDSFYIGTFRNESKLYELSYHQTYEDKLYPDFYYSVVVRTNRFNPLRPTQEIISLTPRGYNYKSK